MNRLEKQIVDTEPRSFKENIEIIRSNLFSVLVITVTSLAFSIIYAINAINIYKSTSLVKISKPTGSVLDAPMIPSLGSDFGMDRFLLNEIEIIKSYQVRKKVAAALIDTFKAANSPKNFFVLIDKTVRQKKDMIPVVTSAKDLIEDLGTALVDQKRGLDFVEISFQSPSAYEAALIVNCYTKAYKNVNLEFNRNQLTMVKEFMTDQKEEKLKQLNQSEEVLRNFQEKGGIVALDQQAQSLIDQLSTLESQRDLQKIELISSEKTLQKYRSDLKEKSPEINSFLANLSSEEYLKTLQTQLAQMKINKELALSEAKVKSLAGTEATREYDKKIKVLEDLVNQKLEVLKASIFATNPDELKEISKSILEQEIKVQAAKISIDQITGVIKGYETKFNLLPKSAIEFARLQRNRESLEKLYLLVEEKYQEAVINEQSEPGNVLIVDEARIATQPFKPNRTLIIAVGFVLGLVIAFGYIFLRNYFDNTIKTPDDIQRLNTNVLAWIPQIEGIIATGSTEFEFIVAKKPDSIPAESFRALRTRVQFSRVDAEQLKTILVTSSAPSEGKTMICTNLAGSFALSNKKTLILDCDLRKPRIHSFFKSNRYPGLVDYLFGQVTLEEIIRPSEIHDLYYITAGTIPPNPSEILESQKMANFLNELRDRFDYILLDSPPVIAVTDSEILARLVDATTLIVSANTTEIELMLRALEIIKQDNINFIGTILNNFVYKSSYGSYYKYYYYYTRPRKTDHAKLPPQQLTT